MVVSVQLYLFLFFIEVSGLNLSIVFEIDIVVVFGDLNHVNA